MRVPRTGRTVAVHDLHESHPLFDEAAGGQELHAEGARHLIVEAVQGLRLPRFLLEIQDLRDGRLHAEGQLVGLDAGGKRRIVGVSDRAQLVEPSHQAEHLPLERLRRGHLGPGEHQRLFPIDLERHGIVGGAQVVSIAGVEKPGAHGDEFGQVLVERSQPPRGPGADRGEAAVEHVPARVELDLCAVIVVGRPHRADDGQIVDAAAHVREEIAHRNAALAAGAKLRLQGKNHVPLLAVGVVDDDDPHLLQLFGVLDALVRCRANRLPRVAINLGLGIKRLEMTEPTPHEEPDDVFRPRRPLRQAGPRRAGHLLGPQYAFQGHRAEAKPGPEEMPPRQTATHA